MTDKRPYESLTGVCVLCDQRVPIKPRRWFRRRPEAVRHYWQTGQWCPDFRVYALAENDPYEKEDK